MGEVIWLRKMAFVRSVTLLQIDSTISSGDETGSGSRVFTSEAPSLASSQSQAIVHRAILVVGGENFVARVEIERANDDD